MSSVKNTILYEVPRGLDELLTKFQPLELSLLSLLALSVGVGNVNIKPIKSYISFRRNNLILCIDNIDTLNIYMVKKSLLFLNVNIFNIFIHHYYAGLSK